MGDEGADGGAREEPFNERGATERPRGMDGGTSGRASLSFSRLLSLFGNAVESFLLAVPVPVAVAGAAVAGILLAN